MTPHLHGGREYSPKEWQSFLSPYIIDALAGTLRGPAAGALLGGIFGGQAFPSAPLTLLVGDGGPLLLTEAFGAILFGPPLGEKSRSSELNVVGLGPRGTELTSESLLLLLPFPPPNGIELTSPLPDLPPSSLRPSGIELTSLPFPGGPSRRSLSLSLSLSRSRSHPPLPPGAGPSGTEFTSESDGFPPPFRSDPPLPRPPSLSSRLSPPFPPPRP